MVISPQPSHRLEIWEDREVDCTGECIECSVPGENAAMFNVHFTDSATESEFPDLSSVPPCYHHLQEVFNKKKAMSLPPHRPYDCTIDILPGSNIPKGCLYSVSGPEKEAMKEYIETSLTHKLAGFFFVGKRDGSLRPCIDYSPLNDITIKKNVTLLCLLSLTSFTRPRSSPRWTNAMRII